MTSSTASPEIISRSSGSGILLQKIVSTIVLENNNSTLTTTLTPLAPPLDNDTVDNHDAFVTVPRNENKSRPAPEEVVQSQQQMTTINFLESQNKIHLDPQIKKDWQKTGKEIGFS